MCRAKGQRLPGWSGASDIAAFIAPHPLTREALQEGARSVYVQSDFLPGIDAGIVRHTGPVGTSPGAGVRLRLQRGRGGFVGDVPGYDRDVVAMVRELQGGGEADN